jgi:hypothetical protein
VPLRLNQHPADAAILAAYRDLISSVADQRAESWSAPQDLPRLQQADILTVLQAREADVLDELRVDAGYMAGALRLAIPDMTLGSHLFVALEFAAREVIFEDVFEECELRSQERNDRGPRESADRLHGVTSAFRRSHR